MLTNKKYNRLNEAIETMHQVQRVNQLIQGVCARIDAQELTKQEAAGLWAVLEWQNEKLGVITMVMEGEVAASTRAANG